MKYERLHYIWQHKDISAIISILLEIPQFFFNFQVKVFGQIDFELKLYTMGESAERKREAERAKNWAELLEL